MDLLSSFERRWLRKGLEKKDPGTDPCLVCWRDGLEKKELRTFSERNGSTQMVVVTRGLRRIVELLRSRYVFAPMGARTDSEKESSQVVVEKDHCFLPNEVVQGL